MFKIELLKNSNDKRENVGSCARCAFVCERARDNDRKREEISLQLDFAASVSP